MDSMYLQHGNPPGSVSADRCGVRNRRAESQGGEIDAALDYVDSRGGRLPVYASAARTTAQARTAGTQSHGSRIVFTMTDKPLMM